MSATLPTDREAAAALLNLRNRDGSLGTPVEWNETLATIMNHRSVRGFLPQQLPDGALELLIAAAQSASTSSNLQVWSVVAVRDPARKSRIADLAGKQQFIRDAPLMRPTTPSPATTGMPTAMPSAVPRPMATVASKLPGEAAMTSAGTLGMPEMNGRFWFARRRAFSRRAARDADTSPWSWPTSRRRRRF